MSKINSFDTNIYQYGSNWLIVLTNALTSLENTICFCLVIKLNLAIMKVMGLLLAASLLGLLFFVLNSNTQTTPDNFDGWEFLQWKYDKSKVEEVLQEKGIDFDPGQINQKQGPTTEFIYNDMEIRLAYDMGHLYDVQQNKYFGVDKKDQADIFFNDLKSKLTEKYGKPLSEINDTERQMLEIVWNLKYTSINLNYFYSEDVVDGLEDLRFTISIQANKLDK